MILLRYSLLQTVVNKIYHFYDGCPNEQFDSGYLTI